MPDYEIEIPEQRLDDVRGLLTFTEPLPDVLQRAEDATQAADHAHMRESGRRRFARMATPTERTLLQKLGYTLPPHLRTLVSYQTATLRRRTWPALENGVNP